MKRTITVATTDVPNTGLPYPLPEGWREWTMQDYSQWLADIGVPLDKLTEVTLSCIVTDVYLH
jgi:hypothetical protein